MDYGRFEILYYIPSFLGTTKHNSVSWRERPLFQLPTNFGHLYNKRNAMQLRDLDIA